MKVLVFTVAMSFVSASFANRSCFSDESVKDLIETSERLGVCFSGDADPCNIKTKPVSVQANLNSKRLVPFDRFDGDGFMDKATGQVTVKFGSYPGPDSGKQFSGSAQKISRCHIITSAHLLYTDAKFPVDSQNLEIYFKFGQSCNSNEPFRETTAASLLFGMTEEMNGDFNCTADRENDPCERREFRGHRDIVILRLKKFDRNERSFFSLNVENPNSHKIGQKVNCWGFPGGNSNLTVESSKSRLYLWRQENAQVFGDRGGEYANGILTNAIAYKGMSGGGCVISDSPRKLVGLLVKDNKLDGRSAVDIVPGKAFPSNPNYLSGFHELSERYKLKTGKDLSRLDEECDR